MYFMLLLVNLHPILGFLGMYNYVSILVSLDLYEHFIPLVLRTQSM